MSGYDRFREQHLSKPGVWTAYSNARKLIEKEQNMKASDFEIGATVKCCLDGSRGTIIGNKLSDGDQVVAVEWENQTLTKYNISDLKLVNTTLEAEYALIQENVRAAAHLLSEANKIAQKNGTNLCGLEQEYDGDEPLINMGALMNALDEGGWSTSSMSC